MKIVLVEDDAPLRKMIRLMLGELGHEVIELADGRKVLATCEEQRPDLVLTDLVMPEQEGLETIGQLRKRQPAIPVVAMSGGGRNNPRDYLIIAKKLGAAAVLAKPFTAAALAEAIAEAVGKPETDCFRRPET